MVNRKIPLIEDSEAVKLSMFICLLVMIETILAIRPVLFSQKTVSVYSFSILIYGLDGLDGLGGLDYLEILE
jgi:hypothetical protein